MTKAPYKQMPDPKKSFISKYLGHEGRFRSLIYRTFHSRDSHNVFDRICYQLICHYYRDLWGFFFSEKHDWFVWSGTRSIIQILSFQAISSSTIFRHFYQVNFSRQNIVNREGRVQEVGLDIRFSGVQQIHMQMKIWKRLWWWCNMLFRLADTGHFHE